MKSTIHQTPEEKLASNTERIVEAVNENGQKIDRAVSVLEDVSRETADKTANILGFTGLIKSNKKNNVKLEEVKSASLITNRELKKLNKGNEETNQNLKNLLEEVKKKEEYEEEIEVQIDPEEIRGLPGKNYEITEKDYEAIANKTAPKVKVEKEKVIERVIEKREIVKEKPVITNKITNEVVEVAKYESPAQIIEKINSSKKKIDHQRIKGLSDVYKFVDDYGKFPQGYASGGANQIVFLDEGTRISDHVTELNFTGSGVSATYGNDGRINVSVAGGGGSLTVVSVTGTYNATQTSGEYLLICDASGGAVTVNLPTAVGNTAKFEIHKSDSSTNTVTVDPDGAQQIKGDTTLTIKYQFSTATIVSDDSGWVIV